MTTIVTRAGKGSALTITEGDANFTNLNNDKLEVSGDTITGTIDFDSNTASNAQLDNYRETVSVVASSGTTETITVATAHVFDITLDDNCTFTFTNPGATDAYSFTVILRQDATGNRIATWPASVDWPQGVEPVLSTAASSVDIINFFTIDNGTTWFGVPSGFAFS